MQMAKRSQARSAGKVYVPPEHKLSCDPRCSPGMCSPGSIGSYIFLKTAGNGWQFAKMVEHGNICQRGGAFWQSGAARCSRARSCLVAIRNGWCDNDDATSESITFSYIGIYEDYMIWERSGSRGVCLVVREDAVCLVALRDGRCDNDDATFDNFRSYILGGRVTVIGEADVAACRCRSSERS